MDGYIYSSFLIGYKTQTLKTQKHPGLFLSAAFLCTLLCQRCVLACDNVDVAACVCGCDMQSEPNAAPDPDKFVNLADVPSPCSSPEHEVFLHNSYVIKRRIAARQTTALQRLVLEQQQNQSARRNSATAVTTNNEGHGEEDYDSDATMDYESAPGPVARTYVSPLQQLIQQCQTDEDNTCLDPPECKVKECPFCTGPLMAQRYILAQRLVQLDRVLYGHPTHKYNVKQTFDSCTKPL